MTFEDMKPFLLSGKQVTRKNWGNGSKIFYLQIDDASLRGNTSNSLDYLTMFIKENDTSIKKMLWTDDFKDDNDDWYVLNHDTPVRQGWQCPRCGKIYSPYEKTCECTNTEIINCEHIWAKKMIPNERNDKITYVYECLNCGLIKPEDSTDDKCEHSWYLIGIESVDDFKISKFKCDKCNDLKIVKESLISINA